MKRVGSNNMTTEMLSKNFKAVAKRFIAQNKAYSFMNPIKGIPAYWKKFLHEVLAMIRQLVNRTFFFFFFLFCLVSCESIIIFPS